MQMAMFLADTATEISVHALSWLWQQCHATDRAERKLLRLQARGMLETTSVSGSLERIVRLTQSGRLAAMGGRDPQAWWSRPWDGRWRVVVFDVPEKKQALRLRLRRKLHRLHFGYLQDSVWISPDPIDAIKSAFSGERVDAAVLTFMDASPCGGESHQDLVAGAWEFSRLNRLYSTYRGLLDRTPASLLRPGANAAARHQWLLREWKHWEDVTRRDPFLPDQLLPPGYQGKQAWAERQKILGAIAASALETAPHHEPDRG
jgi:phenylacetic acid degradation operon negative regulatory protein